MQEFVLVEVIVIVVAIFSFMSILTTIPRADVVVASEHPRLEKFAWIVGWTIRWTFTAALAFAAYWIAAKPGAWLTRATFADYVTWDTWFIPAGGAAASFLLSFALYQSARWCSRQQLPRVGAVTASIPFAVVTMIHFLWMILVYFVSWFLATIGWESGAEFLIDQGGNAAKRLTETCKGWHAAVTNRNEGPLRETMRFFIPPLPGMF